MKSINLMTLEEIKVKFSVNEMLEKIKTFTKDLENARIKMMHAKSQMQYSWAEYDYQIAQTKIRKLETLAY